jgi:hypothetical protein
MIEHPTPIMNHRKLSPSPGKAAGNSESTSDLLGSHGLVITEAKRNPDIR